MGIDFNAIKAGDHLCRYTTTGYDAGRSTELQDLQLLRVVRVNRVTVTVDTMSGTRLRVDRRDIIARVSPEDAREW